MNIVLFSSTGRCGIREYTHILMGGFQDLGHTVRYIGVRRHDNRDLVRCVRQIGREDEVVIFEYEPGIFWAGGLVRAMAWLRFFQRKRIVLSVHEIEPAKLPEVRKIEWHLARPVSQYGLLEMIKLLPFAVDVVLHFMMLRVRLLLMGWLPHIVLVHSPKAAESIDLILAHRDKVRYVPHVVKRLEGDRERLRQELGLPTGCFAFIIPGFLFRRKRITEVIGQLPPDAELWIVGTESERDPGYLSEIQTCVSRSAHREHVRLIQDYERMEQYLMAADAVIMYYSHGYQSGVASLAVGAGKPTVFSDIPAFSDLCRAGLTVGTTEELRRAMVQIQNPDCYDRLAEAASLLREQLSPRQIARQYLESLGNTE